MSIIFAGPGFEILEYQLVSIELMILLPSVYFKQYLHAINIILTPTV